MSKAIDEAFGVNTEEVKVGDVYPMEPKEEPEKKQLASVVYKDGDSNDDFKYARDNYYNIIQRAQEALEDMLVVAQQSESPRAYEVFSNLVNTIANANRELVKMAQEKEQKEIDKLKTNEGPTTVNNTLIVKDASDLKGFFKNK